MRKHQFCCHGILLFALAMCTGCPPNGSASELVYLADVIPITSDMCPTERAIVGDLNKNLDTRGSRYSGDRRDSLLTAWAILKSKGTVVISGSVEEE